LVEAGFRAEYLAEYKALEGRYHPSAAQWIAQSALDFLSSGHDELIPVDTLLARVDAKSPPELREQCRALVSGLRSQTGDGADVEEIAGHVSSEYRLRALHESLMRVRGEVLAEKGDPERGIAILREYLERMEDMRGHTGASVYTLGGTAGQHTADYCQRESNPEAGMGIPTGLLPFDKETGGIRPGEVAVLIGRTSGGKTSFCGAVTANAYLLGKSVAYAGQEMYGDVVRRRIEAGLLISEVSDGQVHRRRALVEGGAVRALECGALPPELRERFLDLQGQFTAWEEAGRRFWVLEPNSYRTIEELGGQVARIKRRYGLDLLWVDSLNIQSLDQHHSKDERHDLKQGDVVQSLRRIALANHVAVLVDSQEKTQTWTKRYAGLDEVVMYSGAISHRTDHVLRIYSPPNDVELREIQHLKNRNGKLVPFFPVYFHSDDMVFSLAPKNILDRGIEGDARGTVEATMGGDGDDL